MRFGFGELSANPFPTVVLRTIEFCDGDHHNDDKKREADGWSSLFHNFKFHLLYRPHRGRQSLRWNLPNVVGVD